MISGRRPGTVILIRMGSFSATDDLNSGQAPGLMERFIWPAAAGKAGHGVQAIGHSARVFGWRRIME